MSKPTWARIVYGRTYHLDFRFITVPHDFSAPEIAWASPYILATTQQARNLADSPRWSLFKNKTHCIVGVTCMVRDLIGKLVPDSIEVMAKDEHGRPLYVFLGYVTQLDRSLSLTDLPGYTETSLIGFKRLYREIERVWLAKDYDDRNPFVSEYQPLNGGVDTTIVTPDLCTSRLNNVARYPYKTFVWQRSIQRNYQLWLAAAQCLEPTSICLDIKGKHIVNSPFLNQTITKIDKFTIRDRHIHKNSDRQEQPSQSLPNPSFESSTFKQIISTRAKEDIDLTLQQAAKVTSASQNIINNLTGNHNNAVEKSAQQSDLSPEREIFGLKTKKSSSSSEDKNWF